MVTRENRDQESWPEERRSAGLSLISLGIVLLRRRYSIALVTMAVAGLMVAAGFLARRTYTASASFMPQSSDRGLSRLAGLAAQLGLGPSLANPGPSPDFYAGVLTSRQLLRNVANTRVKLSQSTGAPETALPDLWNMSGTGPLRIERTVDRLRKAVGAVSSAKTGLVEMTVRTQSPELSRMIAQRMLDLLNDFNLRTRQSQARAERQFVEGRLEEVRADLRTAENALQRFLQQNREFRNSPPLMFEEQRLEREVQMRQQIFSSLAQSFEQSRIDEVRDTPVITVVESPTLPVEPDSRRIVVRGVLGVLLGLMLGVLIAFAQESGRRNREAGDEDYQDLLLLRREAVDDLTRPLRSLRPRGGHRKSS